MLVAFNSYSQRIKRAIDNNNIKSVYKWLNQDYRVYTSGEEKLDYEFITYTIDGDSAFLHPLVYACSKGRFEIASTILEWPENIEIFGNRTNLLINALSASINSNSKLYKSLKDLNCGGENVIETYNNIYNKISFYEDKNDRPYNDSIEMISQLERKYEQSIDMITSILFSLEDLNAYCSLCHDATPVAIALMQNNYPVFNLLKEKKVKFINEEAGIDLIHALSGCDSLSLLKEIVEDSNLNVNQKDKYGANSLMWALSRNKLENARYLISKGSDIAIRDFNENDILFYCPTKEVFLYAEELLRQNQIVFSYPPIQVIIEWDDKELFDYYLNHFPDKINEKVNGENAFFSLLYVKSNTVYFFSRLKELGLHLEKDKNGKTLLYYSKLDKNKTLVKLIKATK